MNRSTPGRTVTRPGTPQSEKEHNMTIESTSSARGARLRPVRRMVAFAAAALLATSALAACSSSGSGAASGSGSAGAASNQASLDAVNAYLTAASVKPVFTPPGPPVNAAAAKGKKIFYLSVTMSVDVVQNWWHGLQAAADAAGVAVTSFDGKGQPSEYVRGMETAIAQKYDLILIDGISSESLAEPIKKARAAGIKVIICDERPTGDGGPVLKAVDGGVSLPYADAAQLEADWVIANAKGASGQVAIFRMPNVPAHDSMVDRIKSEFQKYAPGLQIVDIQSVAVSDWGTRLPTLTRSTLTRFPNLKYIIPLVDGMAVNVAPAVQQANKANQVSIATFNATPAVMRAVLNGSSIKADIGGPNSWQGWAYMDESLRLLTGMKPVEEHIPLRMFDTSNIGKIGIDANESTWYNTDVAIAGYKKLWAGA
jgi:ribose transport system substrate-binding protein